MGNLFVSEEKPERAVLVGLDRGHDSFTDADAEESLNELKELADTAGAESVGKMLQKRTAPDPETFLGSGKTEELKGMNGICGPGRISRGPACCATLMKASGMSLPPLLLPQRKMI